MQLFVYELITGGGLLANGEPLSGSLLAEGQAMVRAVTADLARLPRIRVVTTRDDRLAPLHDSRCEVHEVTRADDEPALLRRLAAAADWTLLIAPETAGQLLTRARLVAQSGGKLLSPGPAVIELAADKQRTCEHLASRGVRCPPGEIFAPGMQPDPGLFPAVLKPSDGCGSAGVRRIESPAGLPSKQVEFTTDRLRIERFVPGLAASVAVLCGPAQHLALPACRQLLSTDGRFQYQGGRLPMREHLDARARRLALAAAATLPEASGYVGIDLVLGADAGGGDDHVIEINPRLTTSYVGLRALCRDNLAEAMLAVAEGRAVSLSWRNEALQFTPAGDVIPAAQTFPSDES